MKLTFVLQALCMGFLLRSNSAKLLPGTGGKDVDEGVSKCTPSLFYVQSPDFHKLGLCYYLKILYL